MSAIDGHVCLSASTRRPVYVSSRFMPASLVLCACADGREGLFFVQVPRFQDLGLTSLAGVVITLLNVETFFFKFFSSPSFPGPRPRGNTRGSMAGVTITLLKVTSFSKLYPSPTFPGLRPHGNTRGSSYHSLKSDHVPCVSRTSASRARVNGGSNYHSLKSDKFLETFSKSHVSRTSASRNLLP